MVRLQGKHSLVCGVKGKFAHRVKALYFAFERLDYSPSSNEVITCWVSFTALMSTRAKLLVLSDQSSIQQSLFNPFVQNPAAQLSNMRRPGKIGESWGKTLDSWMGSTASFIC